MNKIILPLLCLLLMPFAPVFALECELSDCMRYRPASSRYRVEFDQAYLYAKVRRIDETLFQTSATLSAYVRNDLNFSISVPYEFVTLSAGSRTVREDGLTDVFVDSRWTFYEQKGKFNLVLRTGVILPTGDYKKGFGSGRVRGNLFLTATKELSPVSVFLNLGYRLNSNRVGEENHLWLASLGGRFGIYKNLKGVVSLEVDRQASKNGSPDPISWLVYLVYPINGRFDLNGGVRGFINSTEYIGYFGTGFNF